MHKAALMNVHSWTLKIQGQIHTATISGNFFSSLSFCL
jgi:hypothetical protein